jgi:predicted HAD superfamily Cof-like phosphohydrolase
MSKDWVADMAAFHDRIGSQPEVIAKMPDDLIDKMWRFRLDFLNEEMTELIQSECPEDAVDALVDLIYVAVGTLHLFGVDVNKAWDVVQQANMQKERGVKPNRPNPFGLPDAIKPDGWETPSHEGNHGLVTRVFRDKTPPRVVCLCGSTRFPEAWVKANREETLAGRIVLSVGMFGHQEGVDMNGPVKQALDRLHFRKIDRADEVLILNVDGYIGESTRRELEYARRQGKVVRFLEPEKEVSSATR